MHIMKKKGYIHYFIYSNSCKNEKSLSSGSAITFSYSSYTSIFSLYLPQSMFSSRLEFLKTLFDILLIFYDSSSFSSSEFSSDSSDSISSSSSSLLIYDSSVWSYISSLSISLSSYSFFFCSSFFFSFSFFSKIYLIFKIFWNYVKFISWTKWLPHILNFSLISIFSYYVSSNI